MSEAKKFFRPGSKKTKEFLLARTMMVLVLVFLILNTPRLILGVIEVTQLKTVEQCYEHGLDYQVSKQTYILDFLARFLVILNSSVNFVIYCLVGSEFRANLYTRRGWRPQKSREQVRGVEENTEWVGEENETDRARIKTERNAGLSTRDPNR